MALHLLASINSESVARCHASLSEADSLLLLADGVYALQSEDIFADLSAVTNKIFVLAEDLHCRLPHLEPSISVIDYVQWVQLSITSAPVVSWY
ncbi:MAG: sulfurtransferase complex subunit TusB [Moraxellaceae bacterium]|nr:MAG: sulfurtransferase complex subunit TusB [Moraxellaceae bacterium]